MSNIYLLNFPANFKPEGDLKRIENVEDIDITEDDIFMVFEFSSPLAARLEYFDIPAENLVIAVKDKRDLKELARREKINFRNDYPIFSGGKINSTDKQIKKDILIQLKLLSAIAYDMIEAGYLVEENRKKIKDWIVSFEEPILKILIIYHKIETSNPSFNIEDEFMINPQFRKMILVIILKILANFIINNDLANIEEISKIGNWMEENTWMKIKDKVKLFNN